MGEKRKSDAMDLSLASLDGFTLERVLGRCHIPRCLGSLDPSLVPNAQWRGVALSIGNERGWPWSH